jgi:hypothetical protein
LAHVVDNGYVHILKELLALPVIAEDKNKDILQQRIVSSYPYRGVPGHRAKVQYEDSSLEVTFNDYIWRGYYLYLCV